ARQPPDPRLVEQRDSVPLLAPPLDLHELQAALPAGGLQRIRPPANDDGRPHRGHAVDDGPGPPGGADGLAAAPGQDAGEGEVHALQRPQHADLQRSGRVAERLDQLVGALVPLPPLAEAAVDDLLEVIAARETADLGRADPHLRVALDQHPEELAHLVDVVTRLPLGNRARENVAGGRQRVHGARGDPSPVALLPDDPEIAELQAPAVADEHVQRREVAVEVLAAVQLSEHLEDARDLAARGGFRPPRAGAVQEGAEVAVSRVLEGQAVQHGPPRARQGERVEDADRARVTVQELPEVGLPEPTVDAFAGLDAHGRRDDPRPSETPGEVGLAEPALAEQPLDAIAETRLRARDDLRGREQALRVLDGGADGSGTGPRAGRVARQASVVRHQAQPESYLATCPGKGILAGEMNGSLYPAARTFAPRLEEHFARHAAAGPNGAPPGAPLPDARAIEALIDAA